MPYTLGLADLCRKCLVLVDRSPQAIYLFRLESEVFKRSIQDTATDLAAPGPGIGAIFTSVNFPGGMVKHCLYQRSDRIEKMLSMTQTSALPRQI